MIASSQNLPRWFNTCLWGNTVALSWMWGLGLFFSVQFSSQFGLFGLLSFAIPNMLGLWAFGMVTHHLARRREGSESLAQLFTGWYRPFRLVFFLYQVLAITLTIFALIRYGWLPLSIEPDLLYLPLTLLIVLAASILFGEEFDIRRIKWSHGAVFLLVLTAITFLLTAPKVITNSNPTVPVTPLPTNDWHYWGYAIPIIIGFLVGPWLDLQQWQRAIQMHRERVSIAAAYTIGSLQFFLLLLFHGLLALWALNNGSWRFIRTGLGDYQYAHDSIMQFLFQSANTHPWIFAAYCVFICACVLATLDSGYVALRWFLQTNVRASSSPIFSILPASLFSSPIPVFIFSGIFAAIAAILGLELEYFMIFYATFFVGYAALGIVRNFVNTPANAIPQIKMFCIGSLAVVIFAYGYFLKYPAFMIIGSLLPLGYIIWLLFKPTANEDFVSGREELGALANAGVLSNASTESISKRKSSQPQLVEELQAITPSDSSASSHSVGGHFEGKWFVHSFVATYADTNSVGNVYFGMYAMWVGKTRELFFNKVMPKFNLKDTPFYILTRSFEHKFIRETREFETVSVRIRISSYNRKFSTLEHEIYDSQDNLLGKGKQTLLFVASSDYRMIDIPPDVMTAFLAHA